MNWTKRFVVFGSSCCLALNFGTTAAHAQPYVVYVPGSDAQTLSSVKSIASSAFRTTIQGQSVIQAGAFNSSGNADALVQSLRQSGFSATKYYRGSEVITSYPGTTTSPGTVFLPPPTTTPIDTPIFNNYPPTTTNNSTATPYSSSSVSIPYTIPNGSLVNGGQVPQYRYITAVPAGSSSANARLQQVRQFIPGAFLANSFRGSYVYAGVYPNRDGAEALSYYLRSQGLDARVLYF